MKILIFLINACAIWQWSTSLTLPYSTTAHPFQDATRRKAIIGEKGYQEIVGEKGSLPVNRLLRIKSPSAFKYFYIDDKNNFTFRQWKKTPWF